jgi:hypothetical protein
MTVSIENSFLTEKALDYAKLSSLAYLTWDNDTGAIIFPSNMSPEEKEYYNSLWNELSSESKRQRGQVYS